MDKNDVSNIRDYELGLDDLGQPNVIDMTVLKAKRMNSAALLISRILFIRKGTYADQPDMGIDIVKRYRFSFEEELLTLNNELKDQITEYLPEFLPVNVNCSYMQKNDTRYVNISILANGMTYNLYYNTSTNRLESIEGT